ncbi:MAG TPA: UbiD family decarboxylase [Anaerolineales bacterium]|nr:UbiD family decarboxylase [Anaerolineales bacterium]
MPYEDLRDWLSQVEEMGELRRVHGATLDEDVGRITEMLQHTDDAPAALLGGFEGYPPGFRILVNALSKRSRIALTLGLPADIGAFELMDRWMKLNDQVEPVPVRYVDEGPILENVMTGGEVDVTVFPTPLWHELDGGRYIGTGCVNVIKDPDSDWINLGTYRGMIQDKSKVGIYISPGKHGRIFRDKYFERGEKMPIAMIVGGDPLVFISSSLELPVGTSEYEFAGAVRGEPYQVIRGKYTGLPIPAHAEIVLEGFVDPEAQLNEGPFGEWTGYYASSQRPEPYIDIKAIYYRNDPILLGIPPQKPPYEAHRYRVYLRSAMLHKALRDAGVPDVTAVWCHGVGGCRLLNVVAIKQRYAGHARQAGHVAAMCRVGAYLGRIVIVVDDDIDVTDLGDVMWAVCTRSDPERSIDLIKRAWSGPLDPAIPPDKKGFNSRLIIDACRPWEWRDEFPPTIGPSLEVKRATREKWGHLLKEIRAASID